MTSTSTSKLEDIFEKLHQIQSLIASIDPQITESKDINLIDQINFQGKRVLKSLETLNQKLPIIHKMHSLIDCEYNGDLAFEFPHPIQEWLEQNLTEYKYVKSYTACLEIYRHSFVICGQTSQITSVKSTGNYGYYFTLSGDHKQPEIIFKSIPPELLAETINDVYKLLNDYQSDSENLLDNAPDEKLWEKIKLMNPVYVMFALLAFGDKDYVSLRLTT